MSQVRPYGAPLTCPKCLPKNYYGVLKLQGGPKQIRCPNCNTLLINVPRRRSPANGDLDAALAQGRQALERIAVQVNQVGVAAAVAVDDLNAHAAAS